MRAEELRRGVLVGQPRAFLPLLCSYKATVICLHIDNKSRTERNCMCTSQSHRDIAGKEMFCLEVVREDRNSSHIKECISVSIASGEEV